MDAHIRKVYVPMTETGFYILLCLREQQHGYGIVQRVKSLTHGEICLSPGTMYGSLSKMEKDGLIRLLREEEKRRIYEITPLGTEVLELEMKRIERLYQTMRMQERKTEFRFFTVAEWEKEEAYLSRRHREGWRFTGIRLLGLYGFERCEPQEVAYRLDYNPEGRAHREEYVQMFRDCGWEYVQDYVGYSYFRKPAPASERDAEIFCDDASRLEMMERVLKGRMLPLMAILLLVIVPVLIVEGQRTEPFSRFVTLVYLLILAAYVAVFVKFGVQFQKRMSGK